MAVWPSLNPFSRRAAVKSIGPAQVAEAGADATDEDIPRIGLAGLSVLAVIVGIVTGFGAVAFRDLIGAIHNFMFLGRLSVHYDANLFMPTSP
jgi:CIC family chloride channel protein